MSIVSLEFFCLLVISIGIYYVIPSRFRWYTLLLFSVCFFCLSSKVFTGVYLIAGIVITWFTAGRISRYKTEGNGSKARALLIAGILANLCILAALKYTNFGIENINRVFAVLHRSHRLQEVSWLAPLGISFYTLQIIGYLLDVYSGMTTAEGSLLRTALFVGYYPQLTSGPIARHSMMRDSLYDGRSFDWKRVTFGLQRVLWGIFKKSVISARAGVIVDTVYADTLRYDGAYIWVAAAVFMVQLYTDFSGCMDIIIGASECYGVTLPENFRTPFFSQTVQEYWQRWHITLGAWLKDYVLYYILRSRLWKELSNRLKTRMSKKASRQISTYLGMLCVWLIIGLWHGGKWKYIVGMGLWFWLWIVAEQLSEPGLKKLYTRLDIRAESFSWKLLRAVRVFIVVSIGNMFFRLETLGKTLSAIKAGFGHWNTEILYNGSLYELGLDAKNFRILIIGIVMLIVVSAMQEKGSVRERIAGQMLWFRWALYFCLIFFIIIYGQYGPGFDAQSFIYQAF